MIDDLTDYVKKYKAKGLAWIKVEDGALCGGISKFFNKELQNELIANLKLKNNDIIFMIGDNKELTQLALGALRVEIARIEDLAKTDVFKPVWVTDCPRFEFDDNCNEYVFNSQTSRWDNGFLNCCHLLSFFMALLVFQSQISNFLDFSL